MPGPVSDSFDVEFGTAANADLVRQKLSVLREKLTEAIGTTELQNIVSLCMRYDHMFENHPRDWGEVEWRMCRFAIDRALESI